MILKALLGGLLGFITPNVFIPSLIGIVLLNKLQVSKRNRKFYIPVFLLFFILFFNLAGISLSLFEPSTLNNPGLPFSIFSFLLLFIYLVIALWFMGIFKQSAIYQPVNRKFRIIALLFFSFIVVSNSFSTAVVILGAMLVSDSGNTFISFIIYSLGLLIPIGFFLYFIPPLLRKLSLPHRKLIWKTTGIIMLVLFIIRILPKG